MEFGNTTFEELEPFDARSLLYSKGVNEADFEHYLNKDITIIPHWSIDYLIDESNNFITFLKENNKDIEISLLTEKEKPSIFGAGFDYGGIIIIAYHVFDVVKNLMASYIYDRYYINRTGNGMVQLEIHVKDEENQITKSYNIFGPGNEVAKIIRELKS